MADSGPCAPAGPKENPTVRSANARNTSGANTLAIGCGFTTPFFAFPHALSVRQPAQVLIGVCLTRVGPRDPSWACHQLTRASQSSVGLSKADRAISLM